MSADESVTFTENPGLECFFVFGKCTMQNKFSNCFVWVSPTTLNIKFHFLA